MDQFMNTATLLGRLGISRSALRRWRRDRGFPRPIQVGTVNLYATAEVQAWLDGQARA